ncbi:hypothetical protein [Brachybacterium sp. J153]|uniref:hypothetical protein n=1 Tax=Brachybacterium sp. J153 TaxID=3116488 RepID=UPI002E7992D4|nr:hypothetical protein [Brachybacterium sp. J153]MEE1618236.1 hypothetical protein [Brachybacterium sp. J153]
MPHPQMFDDDDPVLARVRAIALALPGAADERSYAPAYLGTSGWLGIDLDVRTDDAELAELIEESYRTVAPARLLAELEQGSPRRA